ncbi:MAG: hypothetical protein FWC01_03985 [Treponema sp.]|nr:hypothetical protein [Treponema sp.]MCL2237150.1 hypothetical protein [Treponema sp.]
MKKLGVILAILLVVTFAASCVSTPKVQMERLIVDLSKLPLIKNEVAVGTNRYADVLLVDFTGPDVFPANVDWGYFNRFRLVIDYFDRDGRRLEHDNDHAMMTLLYDIRKDSSGEFVGGRGGDPGINNGNAAQKQFNLQGSWSNVHTRGCMIMLKKAPAGLLLQNAGTNRVGFIEVKEIVFYNDEVFFEYED